MKLFLTAAAVAAIAWTSPAGATGPPHQHLTRHDRQVIRFFQHHPRLAATPAAGRALSRILPRMVSELRSLQAARAAVPTTWKGSTAYVGRFFGADVAAWELSCSSSEGGWGGFVWYDHESTPRYGYSNTPGGWMQFKGGTFYGIIDEAVANARSKGMTIPPSARSYYSPLGQAVAGAQMIIDGRRGEWAGARC